MNKMDEKWVREVISAPFYYKRSLNKSINGADKISFPLKIDKHVAMIPQKLSRRKCNPNSSLLENK